MADEAGGVERSRRCVEGCEIIGEALVTVIVAVTDQIERRRWRPVEQQRREANPAISGHDSGHTLARLGRHVRGREQRAVVMGVHVDKARRHDLAGDVDLTRALFSADDPMAATRSPAMATSARRRGRPRPSITSPPRKIQSVIPALAA